MTSLFLKYILRKTLTIPLSWSLIYPGYSGDIVVKNIKLEQPAVVSARRADVDIAWNTIFDDVIKVESAEVTDFQAQVPVDNPLRVVKCLREGGCVKRKKIIAGENAKGDEADPGESKKSSRKPLQLRVEQFKAKNGVIVFTQGDRYLKIKVLELDGDRLHLPLVDDVVQVRANLMIDDELFKHIPKEERTFIAEMRWDSVQESLKLQINCEKLPLKPFSMLFPDAGSTKGIQKQLQFFAGGNVTGSITGNIVLSYDGKQRQWTML